VVGLARSGAAAARLLAARGAEVIGVDAGRPAEAEGLATEGVEVALESDGLDRLDRVRTVVKSPGVPAGAAPVAAARARGLELLGELELAWRLLPGPWIAVTGTNGKTTTVELLGARHRSAGVDVVVAGNVGTPLASLVGKTPAGRTIVCEASSFQLEDSRAFAPECAVLLNVAEDHLDRHGTLEAYRKAKLRAFVNQGSDAIAVLPAGVEAPGRARRVPFAAGAGVEDRGGGGGAEPEGVDMADGWLRFRGAPLLPTAEIRLRGRHNLENVMAAAAVGLARGLEGEAVAQALRTFAGVAHRLEEVTRRDGVLFVNDSKATNVASARVGIEAFPSGVHLILGGSLKGGDFRGLRDPVASRVRAVYLIGAAAGAIARDLDGVGVPLRACGDLENAVSAAGRAAEPGDVVLLSPACASFDQFANFEARGELFRALADTGAE
jgi:UDP-N-acetylmuramoylalanine--D-glutamate ligase